MYITTRVVLWSASWIAFLCLGVPPDVKVYSSNVSPSVRDGSLTLYCNVTGIPETFSYKSWTQLWHGTKDATRKTFPPGPILYLPHLTYEHSGVYTCVVRNGLENAVTGDDFLKGSLNLLVKSFPVITAPISSDTLMTSSVLGGNFTFEMTYFSNVDPEHNVKCYKYINGVRIQTSICSADDILNASIVLPVYGTDVITDGFRVEVNIQTLSLEDFGLYDIVAMNLFGEAKRSLEVVQKGPPCSPSNISVRNVQSTSAVLSWIRCFNGGFNQTFLVQLSMDDIVWSNASSIKDDHNNNAVPVLHQLQNLNESSVYFVRVLAYNEAGTSNSSEVVSFSTNSKDETSDGYTNLLTIVLIGCVIIVSVSVVVTGIGAIIWRVQCHKGNVDLSENNRQEQPNNVEDIVEGRGVVDNTSPNDERCRTEGATAAGPSSIIMGNTTLTSYPNPTFDDKVSGKIM